MNTLLRNEILYAWCSFSNRINYFILLQNDYEYFLENGLKFDVVSIYKDWDRVNGNLMNELDLLFEYTVDLEEC